MAEKGEEVEAFDEYFTGFDCKNCKCYPFVCFLLKNNGLKWKKKSKTS